MELQVHSPLQEQLPQPEQSAQDGIHGLVGAEECQADGGNLLYGGLGLPDSQSAGFGGELPVYPVQTVAGAVGPQLIALSIGTAAGLPVDAVLRRQAGRVLYGLRLGADQEPHPGETER